MNIAQPAQAAPLTCIGTYLVPTTLDPPAPKSSWLSRLFGKRPRERDRLLPLYEGIVAVGRDPFWYREGQVPDTVTGRFDMIAAVMALVLVHMERLPDEEARPDSVLLTELFIADMDMSLLEIGVGDYSVGKHVGRLVGALGGRLTAFRDAAGTGDFTAAVRRNIYHEAPPSAEAVEVVTHRLTSWNGALRAVPLAALLQGRVPRP